MSQPYSESIAVCPEVMYTPCDTSSRGKYVNIITFVQFEEVNILTKTCNDAESGDKSDDESNMMSEQDMENINSGDESDHDLISTEMLEVIRDGSQTHPNVNWNRDSPYLV